MRYDGSVFALRLADALKNGSPDLYTAPRSSSSPKPADRPWPCRTASAWSGSAFRLGVERPRVAVAGLNPHASEGGLFGDEELQEIAPAVEAARAAGIDAAGPWPADTVFWRASRGDFDLVVAMYHDQGHIPVKLSGFDDGVNVTLGLPFPRASVDHGTAFDIAGRGVARWQSMAAAIRVSALLARPPE